VFTSTSRRPKAAFVSAIALQHQVHELAVAQDLDETGGLEFLDVVRQRGGADVLRRMEHAAGNRGLGRADLLEDLQATRFGKGARDARELALGELNDQVRGPCPRGFASRTAPPPLRGLAPLA
jgi:hypothetical protein